VFLKDQRKWRW